MGQLEQGTIAVKYYRQAIGVLLDEKAAIEQGRVRTVNLEYYWRVFYFII